MGSWSPRPIQLYRPSSSLLGQTLCAPPRSHRLLTMGIFFISHRTRNHGYLTRLSPQAFGFGRQASILPCVTLSKARMECLSKAHTF